MTFTSSIFATATGEYQSVAVRNPRNTSVIALRREPYHVIVEQDAWSSQRGYDDGLAGRSARCPVGCDKASYLSGWIEGKAAKENGCIRGNWRT